jgi:hypothetical protein
MLKDLTKPEQLGRTISQKKLNSFLKHKEERLVESN